MIIGREQLERREQQILAPWAVTSQSSLGRCYPEPPHPLRTCFQRDRDRIIHSAAFRRLEHKTQVFTLSDNDYYRTRLTHTIEVAQVARTLARALNLNEDLAEAASLAHDLGHPPYGHCGEEILNELMADFGGFEHNRHSLRIVEYLEHPYPSFLGLNLTSETRECLAKHETRYDHPDQFINFPPGQAPLEGQIADLADSIAYNSHDLDDALASGLITEDMLLDELEIYQTISRKVAQDYPNAHRFARQLRGAKSLINLLITDALQEAICRLNQIQPAGLDDIRAADLKLVVFSDACLRQVRELENFLYQRVYLHPKVAQAKDLARRELSFLFHAYRNSPDQLPARYRKRLDNQSLEQVICDYLAGMTDRFCRQCYRNMQS